MRTATAVISIRGLDSDAVVKLKPVLKTVPGVQGVDFNLERSVAVVEFDADRAKVDDLLRAVLKAGYQVI